MKTRKFLVKANTGRMKEGEVITVVEDPLVFMEYRVVEGRHTGYHIRQGQVNAGIFEELKRSKDE